MNRIILKVAVLMALTLSVLGLQEAAYAQASSQPYTQGQSSTTTIPADPLEAQFGPRTWDGLYMVTPLVGMTAWEIETYVEFGCAVPESLFRDIVEEAIGRGEMCGKWFWDRVDKKVKEGSITEFKFRSSLGPLLVRYHKGISQSPNIVCWVQTPRTATAQPLSEACLNSESGGMTKANILGNILGNGGAMALGSFVSNVTAPRAGDFVINNGSSSDSQAGVAANQATQVTSTNINQNANQQNWGFDPLCPTRQCE